MKSPISPRAWKDIAKSKHPMLQTARGYEIRREPCYANSWTVGASHRLPRLLLKKKSLGKRSGRETWHGYRRLDRVSLCEFQQWRCYAIQRFEFSRVCMGENVNSHFSRNFDTVLQQKCLQLQVGKIEQILHYDWLLEWARLGHLWLLVNTSSCSPLMED